MKYMKSDTTKKEIKENYVDPMYYDTVIVTKPFRYDEEYGGINLVKPGEYRINYGSGTDYYSLTNMSGKFIGYVPVMDLHKAEDEGKLIGGKEGTSVYGKVGSMRRESKKEIIEIKEEVRIGDFIFEKGDRIEILYENKITKKDFKQLHSSGELLLVQGGLKHTAKEVFALLENKGSDFINNRMNAQKVTNMDTSSQLGTGFKVTIFHENIHGRDFYIVEDEIDNSLNNQVSWDTLDYYSTVYVKK